MNVKNLSIQSKSFERIRNKLKKTTANVPKINWSIILRIGK